MFNPATAKQVMIDIFYRLDLMHADYVKAKEDIAAGNLARKLLDVSKA